MSDIFYATVGITSLYVCMYICMYVCMYMFGVPNMYVLN